MALEGITFGEQKPACPSCAELRASLESAEAALREIREIIGIDDPMIQESLHRGYDFAIEVGQVKRLAELLDAVLGAAGEEQEPAGG